jgi:pimeloyl-ACP methyl ester carboxylesterase
VRAPDDLLKKYWRLTLARKACGSSLVQKRSFPTVMITCHTISVHGVRLFYREAGSRGAPTLILLHGFPSSSRMFQNLMPLLADRYHVIAPDYPGFGFSEAPPADRFSYTFDRLALFMEDLLQSLEVHRYHLYVQDYGGPVGFRMATRHPEKILSLTIQNAVVHAEGLSPAWAPRQAFWLDGQTNKAVLVHALHSPEAAQQRHLAGVPHPEQVNPDEWQSEFEFLQRGGQEAIQLQLMYDYRTNVAQYPKWQAWLRRHQPPLLVVWGKYDPLFTLEGALLYGREVHKAEIHLLEAGHFALDTAVDEIAAYIRDFLMRIDE